MGPESRLLELSHTISTNTQKLEAFRQASKQADVSFALEASPSLSIPPKEKAIAEARDKVIAASRELTQLLQGPLASVRECSVSEHGIAAIVSHIDAVQRRLRTPGYLLLRNSERSPARQRHNVLENRQRERSTRD